MHNPVARKLYLRIWLAVAGSVAVLSLLIGWAWRVADEERERERDQQQASPREVLVHNAAGELIGSAEMQPRRGPRQPQEFSVTLRDGQQLHVYIPPRDMRQGRNVRDGRDSRRGRDMGPPPPPAADRLPAFLRPPYGFMWMLGLAGLAVMIGVFPVARRLTQRLETLQRGVQRWGEGDLSARVPERGQDEVADLSRRFNAAAERVQSLMDSQAALLQSQKSLLANASHELRSPLARIRMALELTGGAPSADTRAELARNIAELDQLIDEILLASRLDAKEADLGTLEEVDLIGLVAEESMRVNAEFELAPGSTEVLAHGVPRLLRRAVRNLLENAVRHGRRQEQAGPVRAELGVQAGQAVLHVDDHGPGVPPEQQERIFEPFYRLPGASEREGGVGLGLALVRSIAQRHGGSVSCTNRPSGNGARFTLRLPLQA